MKKKLIAELQVLANEILGHNTSLKEAHEKAKSLYELLTVQLYLEENVSENIHTTSDFDVEKNKSHTENLAEPLIEKIKDIVAQMPPDSQHVDEVLNALVPNKKSINDIEVFASEYQQMPEFERKETPKEQPIPPLENTFDEFKSHVDTAKKPKSLNDVLNKGFVFGLNDRLAFTKNLFNGNPDDYTRVVSQLATFDNYNDAKYFIENVVQPDYEWEGKEFYVERLLTIIEHRFD